MDVVATAVCACCTSPPRIAGRASGWRRPGGPVELPAYPSGPGRAPNADSARRDRPRRRMPSPRSKRISDPVEPSEIDVAEPVGRFRAAADQSGTYLGKEGVDRRQVVIVAAVHQQGEVVADAAMRRHRAHQPRSSCTDALQHAQDLVTAPIQPSPNVADGRLVQGRPPRTLLALLDGDPLPQPTVFRSPLSSMVGGGRHLRLYGKSLTDRTVGI